MNHMDMMSAAMLFGCLALVVLALLIGAAAVKYLFFDRRSSDASKKEHRT